jgi:hypothetical protein
MILTTFTSNIFYIRSTQTNIVIWEERERIGKEERKNRSFNGRGSIWNLLRVCTILQGERPQASGFSAPPPGPMTIYFLSIVVFQNSVIDFLPP